MKLRHGDIILKREENVDGEIQKHKGNFTIGYGEKTGHNHIISTPDIKDMEVRKTSDGGLILTLKKEGRLTHPEHKTLKVAPGTYRVTHEQEKDWFSLAVRRVID